MRGTWWTSFSINVNGWSIFVELDLIYEWRPSRYVWYTGWCRREEPCALYIHWMVPFFGGTIRVGQWYDN